MIKALSSVLALTAAFQILPAGAEEAGSSPVLTCNPPSRNDPAGPKFGYAFYVYRDGTAEFYVINHHDGGDDRKADYYGMKYTPSRPYKGHANAYPAQLADARGTLVAKVLETVKLKRGAMKYVLKVNARVPAAEELGASPEVRGARVECFAADPKFVEGL